MDQAISEVKHKLAGWLKLNPHTDEVRRPGARVIRGLEFCQRCTDPPPEALAALKADIAQMAAAAGRSDRLTSVERAT